MVLCLVIAGCGSQIGGEEQPSVSEVTPASVPPTATTPPPPPTLAPGVTAAGISNFSALKRAHLAVLENTSYTYRSRTVVGFPNGTIDSNWTSGWKAGANRTYRRARRRGTPPWRPAQSQPPRIEWYYTDERALIARTLANGTTVYGSIRSAPEDGPLWRRPREEIATATFDFVVPNATRVYNRSGTNGTEVYRLGAGTISESEVFRRHGTPPRNGSLRLSVTARGLIERARWRYTVTTDSGVLTVSTSIRYSKVGTTSVSRPAWYEEAIAATATNESLRTYR
jgi:hypothetical protein